ncbi:MAG: hypothetical protein ACP6IY_06380 [Promethearchaeia archaeon]
MRLIRELGECPNCGCSIQLYKTNSHKRFAKCEYCGLSYGLPKRGRLYNSGLTCPLSLLPILIIEPIGANKNPSYFFTDQPCFNCVKSSKCRLIKELKEEFSEYEEFGFKRNEKHCNL